MVGRQVHLEQFQPLKSGSERQHRPKFCSSQPSVSADMCTRRSCTQVELNSRIDKSIVHVFKRSVECWEDEKIPMANASTRRFDSEQWLPCLKEMNSPNPSRPHTFRACVDHNLTQEARSHHIVGSLNNPFRFQTIVTLQNTQPIYLQKKTLEHLKRDHEGCALTVQCYKPRIP